MSERTSLPLRVWRCALLDADTYEEVEADKSAIVPAAAIVISTALASGLGAWLESNTWNPALATSPFELQLEIATRFLEPIAFWLGNAAFAYMVGASFFRGPETESDYAEVLRTTGFAFAPGVLTALSFIPPASAGLAILWFFRVWVLVALTIAIRQALDFTTGRAIGTVLVAWLIGWLMLWGSVSVLIQTMSGI